MGIVKNAVKRLPPFSKLVRQRDALIMEQAALTADRDALLAERGALVAERDRLGELAGPEPHFAPPGHFYSPIPLVEYVRDHHESLFPPLPRELPAIDLNESAQLALLSVCEGLYPELPFPEEPSEAFRYHYQNESYSYSDAVFLYCMIRHLRPRRIIEVGCGYSSCATLDVNELYFDGGIECTFIEPHPDLLLSLLKDGDRESMRLVPQRLQEIPLSTFAKLEANDILFIDSTHVSKIGSDVNYLIFEILPRLMSGVHVHFHDVFFPFEYPREWVYEGRAWNEDYLLRAFLSFNSSFEIALFTGFLEHFYEERFAENMPLCLKNRGGSIWLRRRAEPSSESLSTTTSEAISLQGTAKRQRLAHRGGAVERDDDDVDTHRRPMTHLRT